jgi:hypothetical protein
MITSEKDYRHFRYSLQTPAVFLIMLLGGSAFLRCTKEFRDVNAEIVEIAKQSDSSVKVLISLFSPGTAYRCSIFVVYDTIEIDANSALAYNRRRLALDLHPCQPVENHEFLARGMRRKRTYYFQLIQLSYFETNGPTASHYNAVGKQEEFYFD